MTYEERLKDIKENPEKHQHEFGALQACCMVDGALGLRLMEAHKGTVPQRNPGGCDVVRGPCSCGAWH
jgi:hypothetical protein